MQYSPAEGVLMPQIGQFSDTMVTQDKNDGVWRLIRPTVTQRFWVDEATAQAFCTMVTNRVLELGLAGIGVRVFDVEN